MFEIGRLCVKLAGRDAGKACVVVDEMDANYVLVDGQTRRRKVNVAHLEPLNKVLDVEKGESSENVAAVLKAAGYEVVTTKPKQAGAKPTKTRKEIKKPAKAATTKAPKKAAAKPKAAKPTAEE